VYLHLFPNKDTYMVVTRWYKDMVRNIVNHHGLVMGQEYKDTVFSMPIPSTLHWEVVSVVHSGQSMYTKDIIKWSKGSFTLGVGDSSVEFLNTILGIWDLNLLMVKILC